MAVTTLGIGGAQQNFKSAYNFHINDPNFFKERTISRTDRYDGYQPSPGTAAKKLETNDSLNQLIKTDSRNVYIYTTESKQVKVADLLNKDHVFKAAKSINQDGKVHYSKKLESKGAS